MELIVNVDKLRDEIKEKRKHYLKTQKVARELYAKKVSEYSIYVNKCVEKDKPIDKAAPYIINESLATFDKAMDALSFHTGETVKISSDELENLRHNIGYAITNYSSSAASLEALAYIL
jgi:hypothetical protein